MPDSTKSKSIKAAFGVVPIVLVLSTIAWVIMYYAFPDYPPDARETALIVAFFTVATLVVREVRKVIKKRTEENEHDE